MAYDRETFYAAVSASLGKLTATNKEGLDALLDAWETGYSAYPDAYLAYALATAYWETGRVLRPVSENLNYSTVKRIRAVWPSRFPTDASASACVKNPRALANKVYGGRMGNVGPDDGWIYRGRGLVQITGKDNYVRAGKALGFALEATPDRALEPLVSSYILFKGMIEGWFTGKRLAHYFQGAENDPVGARRIINGTDKAAEIAAIYRKFLLALLESAKAPKKPTEKAVEAPPSPAPLPIHPKTTDAAPEAPVVLPEAPVKISLLQKVQKWLVSLRS